MAPDRRRSLPAVIAAAGVLALSGGCGQGGAAPGEEPTGVGSNLPRADEPADLDPADFTTEIDNPYWPLAAGTRWVYRETNEAGEELRVVVTVTSATKETAAGVTARVVRDTVTLDGRVIEDTFDWYAQDSEGTVWYLGEDTAEFEDGEVVSREGSFEAGVDGALAGVIMPADPSPGMAYRQEYFEGEAEDNGEVVSCDEQVDVPAGHYDDVLLTKDTITIEPGVLEYKLYARGVGLVLALGISGGGGREELLEVESVSADVAAAAGSTPLGESYD